MRNKFAGVSDPHSFISCSGERIHTLYDSRFDGSRVVLEESGSFDLQERINSFAPYTDISYMLNRLKVGDNSVLSCRPALYGDFAGMPDNPTDAINIYHGAERAFSMLSAEEKLTFNNDFRVWLASLMAGSTAAVRPVADPEPVVDVNKADEKKVNKADEKKVEDVVHES